jgi:hypothetical protein
MDLIFAALWCSMCLGFLMDVTHSTDPMLADSSRLHLFDTGDRTAALRAGDQTFGDIKDLVLRGCRL